MGFFLSSCFYFVSPARKAKKALKEKDCARAVKFLMTAEEDLKKIAEKGVKVCGALSLKNTVLFYEYLIKREESEEKRNILKEKSAQLYFEDLKNYEKALELYSFLKTANLKKREFFSFRSALCFFELKKWDMSLKELKSLITEKPDFPVPFQYRVPKADKMFLKARVLLMREKPEQAEKVFRKIQKNYPLYFKERELFWYLSFIYESRKDFHRAILELKNFQNTSKFLRHKIKRLKERRKSLPAGGLLSEGI